MIAPSYLIEEIKTALKYPELPDDLIIDSDAYKNYLLQVQLRDNEMRRQAMELNEHLRDRQTRSNPS
jgi:hypothetical protein